MLEKEMEREMKMSKQSSANNSFQNKNKINDNGKEVDLNNGVQNPENTKKEKQKTMH
jgi:hypothetical protein